MRQTIALSPAGLYPPIELQRALVLIEATYVHFPQHIKTAQLSGREKPS